MPRKEIDYSKTVIYKIVCNDLNVKDLYVGSTTDFRKRKTNHKSDCINEKKKSYSFQVYETIRKNGGWENWSMIEIEKYPCKDSNEKGARERYRYEQLKGNLNMCVPNRNMKQWENDNNDYRKEYIKKYEQTKERKESHKKYCQKKVLCECGSTIVKCQLPRHIKSNKHQNFINQ